MKIWRRFRAAYFWAKALQAEGQYRFKEALEFVRRADKLVSLKPWHRAFEAMLLVRTGDTANAHKQFAELRSLLKSKSDADSRYTRYYVQSWLATLRVDPFQAQYEQRQAAKVDCRPVLKRWLWLPGEPPRDPHDVEFEEWMEANSPTTNSVEHR